MQQPYQRILLAIDLSNDIPDALEKSASYARHNNIQLDILFVLDPTIIVFGNTQAELSDENLYHLEKKASKQLKEIKNKLLAAGSSVYQIHTHLRFGDPRIIIAQEFPAEYRNDLIILGKTQKNHLQRFFTGSVSSYVIKTAQPDVIIMR
ncbi:MAG: universal stress protein [Liquorilactobacillus ghanensis]|uniref:universal stress protein n=1 Tax=Liquorilactobacillus ghanensis TaxID=399370 RepID=UPI0039EAF070